jgi:hypothetical protein
MHSCSSCVLGKVALITMSYTSRESARTFFLRRALLLCPDRSLYARKIERPKVIGSKYEIERFAENSHIQIIVDYTKSYICTSIVVAFVWCRVTVVILQIETNSVSYRIWHLLRALEANITSIRPVRKSTLLHGFLARMHLKSMLVGI